MSCFTCLRSGADDDVESGADGLSSSRGDRKPKGKRGGKGAVVHDVNVSMTVVAEKEKEEIRRSDMKRRSLHHKGSGSSSALSGGKDEPTPTAAAVAPAHVRITTASSKHEQGELDVLSKTSSMASPVLQRMIHTSSSMHMDINDVYQMKGGRVLGTGVTGAVRVVQHKLTEKEYAHKLLRVSRVRSKRKRKQMHREIQVLKTLDHPNIVKIQEVFEYQNGDLSIVMELCRGDELFEKLLAEKPHYRFLQDDVRRIAQKMFSALNYIHLNNLVHRDIKREFFARSNSPVNTPVASGFS